MPDEKKPDQKPAPEEQVAAQKRRGRVLSSGDIPGPHRGTIPGSTDRMVHGGDVVKK